MIQKITFSQNYDSFKSTCKKFNTLDKVENPNLSNVIHPKLTLNNYKANFLTFMGTAANENLPEKAEDKNSIMVKYIDYYTNKNEFSLVTHDVYDETAKKVAISLAAGKNVNINYNQGSMPNNIVSSFTNLVNENKLKFIGLEKNETEVVLFNSSDYALIGNPVESIFLNLSERAKKLGIQQVVFVEDFHNLIRSKNNPGQIFDANRFKNLHIVGLTPNSTGDLRDHLWDNSFDNLEFTAMNDKQAKEFLKDDKAMFNFVLDKANPVVYISDDAIDKAVDLTKNIAGEYPQKAINLLRGAIAHKNLAEDDVTEIEPHDLDKLLLANPELKKPIVSESGQFEVITDSKVRLSDVGGISEIKDDIQTELLDYIKSSKNKKDMPKGALLYGPPGTGKTLLAKAIAGESGVPFIAASGSSFVEIYVGKGAQRVRELFKLARDEARKSESKTAIVFIDEVDAIAKQRGKNNNSSGEDDKTLNQLLTEMDGLNNDDGVNIIVLAATNRPELLDEAFKRSGRLDLEFEIPNPSRSVKSRLEILQIHAKDRPFKSGTEKKKILQEMAESTSRCSGADLANIMKTASRLVNKKGRTIPYITINDMKEAQLRVEFGREKKSDRPKWEYEKTIAHECAHAINSVVMESLYPDKPWNEAPFTFDGLSITPRSNHSGIMLNKPNPNNNRFTLPSLIAEIVCFYGGYSLERMILGSNADGVSHDLKSISKIATIGVTELGLGPRSGAISSKDNPLVADMMKKENHEDIKEILTTTKAMSDKIIEFHLPFIKGFVEMNKEGNGGDTLSVDGFNKIYKDWLSKDDRQAKLETLKDQLRANIDKLNINEKRPSIGFKHKQSA